MAAFKPIREAWRRTISAWEEKHHREELNKITFALHLEKAIQSSVKPQTLIDGFKVCGLCPYNPNAIDYSNCLSETDDVSQKEENWLEL